MKALETGSSTTVNRETILEIMTTDAIQKLGIPAHIRGYKYLRYALILCTKNIEILTSNKKLLYTAVAAEFNTTYSRVRSDINRAIDIIWDKGNEEALRLYFGNTFYRRKRKPTNLEFIAHISDMLRLRLKIMDLNQK